MKIAIGADHRGSTAAKMLADKLRTEGHEVSIAGALDNAPCDYPERAYEVGHTISSGKADAGILICGTGIGMSIAANKVAGIRAAVVHDELTAELSRTHNNANVICLSADLLGQRIMEKIVDSFIGSSFQGGRHERRLRKIAMIERGEDPSTLKE
ncbi:MAG: ribose 5-phosphate isomerase B [Phycisphaeraceae bacterium]|nr:MAG: ribose 5-phosphate isomerase B [Phycisphaeraceae bacterium]